MLVCGAFTANVVAVKFCGWTLVENGRVTLADLLAEPEAIAAALGRDKESIVRHAQSLRLVPSRSNVIPLASKQICEQLPNLGRNIYRIMSKATAGLLLERNRHSAALLPHEMLPVDRIWLPTTSASDDIPWEAAFDDGENWLALDPAVSLCYRVQWNSLPTIGHTLPIHPRVMVVASMPRGLPSANVELQRQSITRLRTIFPETTGGMFHWSSSRSLEAIRHEVAMKKIDILHIVAHGRPGLILWEDAENRVHPYAAEEFCEQLAGSSPAVVMLSVCDSASPPIGGRSLAAVVAARLARGVIAMRSTLDELAASIFVEHFYGALLRNPVSTLDTLVSAGRTALQEASMRGDVAAGQWMMPTLTLRDAPIRFAAASTTSLYSPRESVSEKEDSQPWVAMLMLPDGTAMEINPSGTTIGRSDRADISIPDRSIRPFHVVIRWKRAAYFLVSLDAKLQTCVNGKSIHEGFLSDGDSITLGNQSLLFRKG